MHIQEKYPSIRDGTADAECNARADGIGREINGIWYTCLQTPTNQIVILTDEELGKPSDISWYDYCRSCHRK